MLNFMVLIGHLLVVSYMTSIVSNIVSLTAFETLDVQFP